MNQKTFYTSASILLIGAAVLFYGLLCPPTESFETFWGILPQSAVIQFTVGALFVACLSTIAIQIGNRYLELPEKQLPLIFLLIALACTAFSFFLQPAFYHLSAICYLWAIFLLMPTFKKPYLVSHHLSSGLFLGIAALLHPPLLWTAVLIFYPLYFLHSWSARTFVAYLLGLLSPFWIALPFVLWRYQTAPLQDFWTQLTAFSFTPLFEFPLSEQLLFYTLWISFIWSWISLLILPKTFKAAYYARIRLLAWYALPLLPLTFFYPHILMTTTTILLPIWAVILTTRLESLRSPKLRKIILVSIALWWLFLALFQIDFIANFLGIS